MKMDISLKQEVRRVGSAFVGVGFSYVGLSFILSGIFFNKKSFLFLSNSQHSNSLMLEVISEAKTRPHMKTFGLILNWVIGSFIL